jgi:anti-sigma-K factor RskA
VDPQTRGRRPIVWPAYLVAAVCFAVAVTLSLMNLSLIEQLKSAQSQLALAQARSSGLVRDLTGERGTVADLMDESAQRFDIPGGQIVRVRDRLYITMHDLAQPPRGKVYQAWTMPKTGTALQPSLTFVPDAHGVAVVALSTDAKDVAAVEISVEPDGGSKAPTTKPLVVEQLN